MQLTYSFDPVCPWTWLTSRWLVRVAALEGHTVTWRSLSLAHVNRDATVPEQLLAALAASRHAHRIINALHEAGDHDGIGRFYEAYGSRVHRRGEAHGADTVRAAAEDAGLDPATIAAMDDAGRDAAVAAATDAAVASAGGDVGSPVLGFETGAAFFGPIVDELPDDEAARRLFHAVAELATVPRFFELKRQRVRPAQTATS